MQKSSSKNYFDSFLRSQGAHLVLDHEKEKALLRTACYAAFVMDTEGVKIQ